MPGRSRRWLVSGPIILTFVLQIGHGERPDYPEDDDVEDVSFLQVELSRANDTVKKARASKSLSWGQSFGEADIERARVQMAFTAAIIQAASSAAHSVESAAHIVSKNDPVHLVVACAAFFALLVALYLFTFDRRDQGGAIAPPLMRSRREQVEKAAYQRSQHLESSSTNLQQVASRSAGGGAAALLDSARRRSSLERSDPQLSAVVAAAAYAVAPNPPPLCEALILKSSQARFLVSMKTLKDHVSGLVEIKGTSLRTLLVANVERGKLSILTVGDQLRSTVSIASNDAMEVFGPEQDPYGRLEICPQTGNYLLKTVKLEPMQHVMTFSLDDFEPSNCRITATTLSGRVVADASRDRTQHQFPDGSDAWVILVVPGADAVLITSCLLAIMLLTKR